MIQLTPELERQIDEMVRSGGYNSANEVVREALRLMEERDLDGIKGLEGTVTSASPPAQRPSRPGLVFRISLYDDFVRQCPFDLCRNSARESVIDHKRIRNLNRFRTRPSFEPPGC